MRRALLALLLISLCFAGAPPKIELPDLGWEENPGFLFAIALLSTALVAIAYAVSSVTQSPQLTAWSKEMMRELMVGVVIVVLVIGAATTVDTMIGSIPGYEGEKLATLGSKALDEHIDNLEKLYEKVAQGYWAIGAYAPTTVSWTPIQIWIISYGRSKMPYLGVNAALGSLSMAVQQLTFQILSLKFVQVFLVYISKVAYSFLLPVGLALRVFPLTKRVGSTIIALSLGGLFMLPAGVIVAGELADTLKPDSFDEAIDRDYKPSRSVTLIFNFMWFFCETPLRLFFQLGELFWAITIPTIACAAAGPGYAACWYAMFQLILYIAYPLATMIFNMLISSWLVPSLTNQSADTIYSAWVSEINQYLLPAVSEMTALSIVMVLIIAVIAVSGTKAISSALGGEFVMYGISRLV